MNCRQVKAKLADWSADNLPDSFCQELRDHLQQCPPCARNWAEFQHTLHIATTSTQPCCSAEVTRAMWQCCEEHIQKKTASERFVVGHKKAWWQISPRMGYASLGFSFVVLLVVSFAPARFFSSFPVSALQTVSTDQVNNVVRDEWIRFSLPPTQVSPFINHHVAMAFDPFADHVASTLISDAATNSDGFAAGVIPVAESAEVVTTEKMQRP